MHQGTLEGVSRQSNLLHGARTLNVRVTFMQEKLKAYIFLVRQFLKVEQTFKYGNVNKTTKQKILVCF